MKIFVVYADEDQERVQALLATAPQNLVFILDHDISKIATCDRVLHIQTGMSYERMSHELHVAQSEQKPIVPAFNLDVTTLNTQLFWQRVTDDGSSHFYRPKEKEENQIAKPAPPPKPITPITPPATIAPTPAPPPPQPIPNDKKDIFDDEDEAEFEQPGAVGGVTPEEKATGEMPRLAPQGQSQQSRATEPTHFTAFYPPQVKPNAQGALMVFVHLPSAYDTIKQLASSYKTLLGDKPSTHTTPSNAPLQAGNPITLVVRVNGLDFAKGEQTIVWQPPYQLVTFLFTVKPDASPVLSGQILVFDGALVVGEIPLTIAVTTAQNASLPSSDIPNNAESGFKKYEAVFASYSHRDTPVMEYFRRIRQKTGQKLLVDIYDLRTGEEWNKRLLQMIDESQVFQLFWSPASASSPYCQQEWQHALGYLPDRPRFVQPVWWGKDITAPPPELAHLHFQKVALPAVTWLQLGMANIRNLLRGRR
jgi:hypothetical protein